MEEAIGWLRTNSSVLPSYEDVWHQPRWLIYSIDSGVVAVGECVPSVGISDEEGHNEAFSR